MSHSDLSNLGYDRLAKHYRRLEYVLFGNELQKSRVAMLPSLPSCRSALVLGDGDGRLLKALCQSQPECRITSLDQSARMLEIQQQRMQATEGSERVTYLKQDARDLRPVASSLDLLVTPYFLDCFTLDDLTRCIPLWLSGVRHEGWLYVVDFHQPSQGWQRLRAKLLLSLMHRFFRWQTNLPNHRLVDLDAVLSAQPMRLTKQATYSRGLMRAQLYQITRQTGS
ncbi:MAG: class I SAM-dependent methyltransferase [Rubripirellula sp.]